jgi:imidazolonepropionase-like amidohydrolase
VLPSDFWGGVANSADDVRQRVRELLGGGADFIKVIATGAVLTSGTTPSAPELTEAEIRAAVEEAANAGTFVAAHAHGAEGIKRAVRAGVRTIEHGSYLDDEAIALMKKHDTWLVADVYNGDYIDEVGRREGWPENYLRKNTETTGTQRQGFAKAVRAVRIAWHRCGRTCTGRTRASRLHGRVRPHTRSPFAATPDAARHQQGKRHWLHHGLKVGRHDRGGR